LSGPVVRLYKVSVETVIRGGSYYPSYWEQSTLNTSISALWQ
jgi:hypothetical protein